MAEHNYKFDIAMSCGGCSGAVERVLKKLDGASALTIPQYSWFYHLLTRCL
jgi:copper chaperone